MKKTNVTISLDQDNYILAKQEIDNLSGFFNEVLKTTLENGNPDSKKVFEIRKYIDSLDKLKKAKEEQLDILDVQIEKKTVMKKEGWCFRCNDRVADRNYMNQPICQVCFMSL